MPADSNTLIQYLGTLKVLKVNKVKEGLKRPVLLSDMLPPSLQAFTEVTAHTWAEVNYKFCVISRASNSMVYEPIKQVALVMQSPVVNPYLVDYIDWLQTRDDNPDMTNVIHLVPPKTKKGAK